MTATVCSCGHRLAIHEFPCACRGGVSYPDEVVACGCFQLHEYQDIAADREQLEAARATLGHAHLNRMESEL